MDPAVAGIKGDLVDPHNSERLGGLARGFVEQTHRQQTMSDRRTCAQRRGDEHHFRDFFARGASLDAFLLCASMQYEHCVVSATPIEISSRYFSGMAPSVRSAVAFKFMNACASLGAKAISSLACAKSSGR